MNEDIGSDSSTGTAESHAQLGTVAQVGSQALRGVIAAWESLPMGHHRPDTVQRWLSEEMKPAIDNARAAIALALSLQPQSPTGHGDLIGGAEEVKP